jgi:hypothetical protein
VIWISDFSDCAVFLIPSKIYWGWDLKSRHKIHLFHMNLRHRLRIYNTFNLVHDTKVEFSICGIHVSTQNILDFGTFCISNFQIRDAQLVLHHFITLLTSLTISKTISFCWRNIYLHSKTSFYFTANQHLVQHLYQLFLRTLMSKNFWN